MSSVCTGVLSACQVFSSSRWRTATSTPFLCASAWPIARRGTRSGAGRRCSPNETIKILEAALLIVADARVHQREDAGEKLVHAFLLNEIVDHRSVLAGESLEALFAAGIGEAAVHRR